MHMHLLHRYDIITHERGFHCHIFYIIEDKYANT